MHATIKRKYFIHISIVFCLNYKANVIIIFATSEYEILQWI